MTRFLTTCFFFASICVSSPVCAWPPPESLPTYIERIRPVSDQILDVLESDGLGHEWIALALAESGGDARNVSKAGAAGLWQLMPATARRYGLRVDADVDERFDVEKSTRAAARYIRHQLDAFDGDILWAVAAYNAGGTNLKRATGYRKGMDFEVVRTIRPAAYALARTVHAIMEEMRDGKEKRNRPRYSGRRKEL